MVRWTGFFSPGCPNLQEQKFKPKRSHWCSQRGRYILRTRAGRPRSVTMADRVTGSWRVITITKKTGDVLKQQTKDMCCYTLWQTKLHNYGKSQFLLGRSTISMAIFDSFLYVYQRVVPIFRVCRTWVATRTSTISGLGWFNLRLDSPQILCLSNFAWKNPEKSIATTFFAATVQSHLDPCEHMMKIRF